MSLVSARDKELADLKSMVNTKNSAGPVVQVRGGWTAAMNAISLPETSPFKSVDQIPLPKDPKAKAQAPKQDKDRSEEEEGTESSEMGELSR